MLNILHKSLVKWNNVDLYKFKLLTWKNLDAQHKPSCILHRVRLFSMVQQLLLKNIAGFSLTFIRVKYNSTFKIKI